MKELLLVILLSSLKYERSVIDDDSFLYNQFSLSDYEDFYFKDFKQLFQAIKTVRSIKKLHNLFQKLTLTFIKANQF